MIVVESAGITDIGRRRQENEDALLLDDDLQLYLVADGLGGHQAGAVASRLVIETIRNRMQGVGPSRPSECPEEDERALSPAAQKLLSSIYGANAEIKQRASQEERCHRMGSTVAAAYFTDEGLVAANVGDSPIWWVHGGVIEQLSVPHTLTAGYAARHGGDCAGLEPQFGHILTRAMGIESAVQADLCEVQCFQGDILVIGSDGLSTKVSSEEIRTVVSQESPEMACRLLVDLANERGGEDNITVIVTKVIAVQRKPRSFTGRVRQLLGKGLKFNAAKRE
jgi:PPM family protein phosphatase